MLTQKTVELTFEHEEQIIDLIKSSILNGDELHIGGLKPTQKNASSFYRLEIFPILFDDDPIFGILEEDKLLGLACCSTKINDFYELKEKTSMGVITITHPDHRQQGLGTQLRLSIHQELYSRGIKKFIFEIKHDNQASLQNAQKIAQQINANTNLISFKFEGDIDVS
jgi:GNAT superfamily N-acetyltransferase